MHPLILASASPRRRALLLRIGVPVEIRPAGVDESPRANEVATDYARRVAADKAEAVAAALPERWVLAADTVVEVEGCILGKAGDEVEARRMLGQLAGRDHRVSTAVAVRGPGGVAADRIVTTTVVMRAIGAAEIADYVAAGEWRGKAGAYAVQGMAAAFVTELRGSVTNVVGLPLAEVVMLLRELGAPGPRFAVGEPA
jgi:septum formation protein